MTNAAQRDTLVIWARYDLYCAFISGMGGRINCLAGACAC